MDEGILVVGAGVAGLAAAGLLAGRGHTVRVVDKGRSVGGRLATRRVGDATLDHGAQFFTVRSAPFAAVVARAEEDGLVYEWSQGFGTAGDGHRRYAVRGGMNRFGKYLAEGLDVVVDIRIESVASSGGRWELRHAEGSIAAHAVVLTAPVPQTLALLDAGNTAVGGPLRSRLDAVSYHPTLALLVVLDGPSAVPSPGGVQLTQGPFRFAADNHAKGISSSHAVTLHATHEVSTERWADDPERVLDELLQHAGRWLGDASVVDAQLKRWLYAEPIEPLTHQFYATAVEGAPLVFAGDAFAGAKVEGAFMSGRAAGAHLDSVMTR